MSAHRRARRRVAASMKVLLVTRPMPAGPFIEAIRARAPELALLEYGSALGDADLADVDVVLGWQMPPGLPARAPAPCAGSARWPPESQKLLAPDLAAHVRVSRIVDREQAAGIAQFVVAMALRHARDLERYEAQQRDRAWLRQPIPMARHRVAVLGTGATGGEIAAWLERCGLVVRGWNRRSPAEPCTRCSPRATSSSAPCRLTRARPRASSTPLPRSPPCRAAPTSSTSPAARTSSSPI